MNYSAFGEVPDDEQMRELAEEYITSDDEDDEDEGCELNADDIVIMYSHCY